MVVKKVSLGVVSKDGWMVARTVGLKALHEVAEMVDLKEHYVVALTARS